MSKINKKKQKVEIIFSDEDINKKTFGIKKEDIFIKNSPYYKKDEIVTCMILKEKLLAYKCSISGCSVNHQWNNKPLHLLINRKNKKHSDLTINNLQFICPNCFLQNYGLSVWQKQIKTEILSCRICSYDITNLSDYNKFNKICKICEHKISKHKKSSARSYTILEQCWDSRKLTSENIGKDYSKLESDYQNMLYKDELEDIVGSTSNNSQFQINFSNRNKHLNRKTKKNNNSDSDTDSDSDSDNDNTNSNNQLQLSNLESSLEYAFQNNNYSFENDNNIDITQLTKDIENIATTIES